MSLGDVVRPELVGEFEALVRQALEDFGRAHGAIAARAYGVDAPTAEQLTNIAFYAFFGHTLECIANDIGRDAVIALATATLDDSALVAQIIADAAKNGTTLTPAEALSRLHWRQRNAETLRHADALLAQKRQKKERS